MTEEMEEEKEEEEEGGEREEEERGRHNICLASAWLLTGSPLMCVMMSPSPT
jgi:hypothetical protein